MDDGLEILMGKMGDFGRYQCFQFILHVLSAVPTGIHMLSLVTVAAVPDHRCAIEDIDSINHTEVWNSSLVLKAIPLNKFEKLDSCHLLDENNSLVECNSWVYDTQYYTSSRGIEWDFVCSRRWMGAIAQTTFMSGVVIGSLVLGPLCDKYGRRTIFVWAGTLQLFHSTVVAFTSDYYAFVIIRFIYGVFAISPFKAGYVLTIELVGPSKRTRCSALFQIMFGVGVTLVGVWGYFIDNRFYLQLVYGLHALVLLPHWFLLDESPRWLWAKGRAQEAITIVKKALVMNKSSETIDAPSLLSNYGAIRSKRPNTQSPGLTDLFRTPNMLKRTLIICGCWFAVSVVYYGLAFNSGKLNGNPYLMMFIGGLVEIPGYTIGMLLVDRLGHRAVLSSTMVLSGMSCVAVVFLNAESTVITVAAMLGKFVISGSFAVIYKYSAELYPTVVRSSIVGLGTMCASSSAALTPMITLLDSFDPKIPTVIFGMLALLFGSCTMLLPETKGRKLPQTLEDGENFGKGDSCFISCTSTSRGRKASISTIGSTESIKSVALGKS